MGAAGNHRNTLHNVACNYICGHYISSNWVLLVSIQGLLVLLCNAVHIFILCISGNVPNLSMPRGRNSFSFINCNLHYIESFLGFPFTRTGTFKIPFFFFLHFMSMHIQGRVINVEFFSYTQKIPKWWIWCYWICPTSWSLNGLLTSQYGDMNREILIFGEHKTVGSFLHDYYGFHHDRLGLVAAVLIAFPVAFAILFAYCIGKLNYQRT